jgi:hypothetical protein
VFTPFVSLSVVLPSVLYSIVSVFRSTVSVMVMLYLLG